MQLSLCTLVVSKVVRVSLGKMVLKDRKDHKALLVHKALLAHKALVVLWALMAYLER